MYVYIRSEPDLYTVGYYNPEGRWMPESDHENREEAARRVHYLNGGTGCDFPSKVERKRLRLEDR